MFRVKGFGFRVCKSYSLARVCTTPSRSPQLNISYTHPRRTQTRPFQGLFYALLSRFLWPQHKRAVSHLGRAEAPHGEDALDPTSPSLGQLVWFRVWGRAEAPPRGDAPFGVRPPACLKQGKPLAGRLPISRPLRWSPTAKEFVS